MLIGSFILNCTLSSGKVAGQVSGVRKAEVNLLAGRMDVDYDETKTSPQAIIDAGMQSKADLFAMLVALHHQDKPEALMQALRRGLLKLHLGAEARMNEPGTLKVENWRWRATREQLTDALAQQIAGLTAAAGR